MTRIAENCTNTNTCCPRKGPCVKIVTTMLVDACRQNCHHRFLSVITCRATRSLPRCSVSPITRLLAFVCNGNNLDLRSRNPIDKVRKAFHQITLSPVNVLRPGVWAAWQNFRRPIPIAPTRHGRSNLQLPGQ